MVSKNEEVSFLQLEIEENLLDSIWFTPPLIQKKKSIIRQPRNKPHLCSLHPNSGLKDVSKQVLGYTSQMKRNQVVSGEVIARFLEPKLEKCALFDVSVSCSCAVC